MWILWPTKTCWHVKDLVFAWFPPNQRFKNQLIYSERCLRNLGDVYICNCWCCTVVPSFLKLWRMTRRLATLLAFLQWLHFAHWNITSLLYFQKFVRIPTVVCKDSQIMNVFCKVICFENQDTRFTWFAPVCSQWDSTDPRLHWIFNKNPIGDGVFCAFWMFVFGERMKNLTTICLS